jgi:hypothetical protein
MVVTLYPETATRFHILENIKAAPHLPRKRLCAAILFALLLGIQELGTGIARAVTV